MINNTTTSIGTHTNGMFITTSNVPRTDHLNLKKKYIIIEMVEFSIAFYP